MGVKRALPAAEAAGTGSLLFRRGGGQKPQLFLERDQIGGRRVPPGRFRALLAVAGLASPTVRDAPDSAAPRGMRPSSRSVKNRISRLPPRSSARQAPDGSRRFPTPRWSHVHPPCRSPGDLRPRGGIHRPEDRSRGADPLRQQDVPPGGGISRNRPAARRDGRTSTRIARARQRRRPRRRRPWPPERDLRPRVPRPRRPRTRPSIARQWS